MLEKAISSVISRVTKVLVTGAAIPHCLPLASSHLTGTSCRCFCREVLGVGCKVVVDGGLGDDTTMSAVVATDKFLSQLLSKGEVCRCDK